MLESRKRGQQTKIASSASSAKRSRVDDGSNNNTTSSNENVSNNVQERGTEIVRNGKVLRMVLKNFMCHSHLAVEFNKRANLLVGKNGSGKSAILAGLTVGLGCNAGQTNRCSSLKDLIKHGESSATIEIHLENASFDAYERHKFGQRIICERTINASGGNTYKLKSEHGHLVSTSRTELLKILLAFNIQVDNPICVLNQDLARSLLKDSDESKQWTFFTKATQIDTIKLKLNECVTIAEQARKVLAVKEQSLQYLVQEIQALEERYQCLESAGKLGEVLKKLQALLAWRNVYDHEQQVAVVDEELKKLRSSIEEQEHRIRNRESLVNETERTIQMHRVDIEGKKTEYVVLKEAYAAVRRTMQDTQTRQAEIERTIRKGTDRLVRVEEEIRGIEQALAERNEDGITQVEREKINNKKQMDQLEERKAELAAMITNAQRDVEMMHNTLAQVKETREEKHHARVAKQSEAARIDRQLEQFETAPRSKLAIYGANVPALDERIRQLHQQGKFSELPRGPLGQYIEVRDKKWSAIVETALGGFMLAYYVNTADDRNMLNALLRREFPDLHQRTIYTGRFVKELYDVREGCVQEQDGTHRLMSLIKVSDPVVMNQLIDSVAIDTILVTEHQSVAIQLTSERENVPRNLSKVIVSEPCSEFYPQPKYRSYGLQQAPARYLQVSMGELKRQTQQRKEQLQRELVELNRSCEEEHGRLQEQTRQLHKRSEELKRLQQERLKIEQNIEALAGTVYVDETEETTLRAEREQLVGVRDKLRELITREQTAVDAIRDRVESEERAVQEKKDAMVAIEVDIARIQAHIESEHQKRHDLQTNRKVKQQALTRTEDELRERMDTRTALNSALEQVREEALKLDGQRPAELDDAGSLETAEQMKKKIHSTEKRIRQANATQGNIDEVRNELEQKMEEQNELIKYSSSLRDISTLLNNTRKSRFAYLHKLTSHMSLRVKHKFQSIMQVRNYVGAIKIDRENGRLALSVVPRDSNIQNAVSTTKSLSGGERSYATVAFLISLWSCVDTPFFFLDEYDVFTDQVNRHTMTRLLLHEANKKPDRQFCFLTPQDMSEIEASPDLTIHRMEDPERC